jgi:hypothetical protein
MVDAGRVDSGHVVESGVSALSHRLDLGMARTSSSNGRAESWRLYLSRARVGMFMDFDHAHRDLGIQTMISIEDDDITHMRATFNKPFRTVELIPGLSHDELTPARNSHYQDGSPMVTVGGVLPTPDALADVREIIR